MQGKQGGLFHSSRQVVSHLPSSTPRERASEICLPVLARALNAAEEAERLASRKLRDAHEAQDAVRHMAERRAREAAAAAADKAEALEQRAAAAREMERAGEQITRLQVEESILRGELWSDEIASVEQHEAWERERLIGCGICHPLLQGRGGRQGARSLSRS